MAWNPLGKADDVAADAADDVARRASDVTAPASDAVAAASAQPPQPVAPPLRFGGATRYDEAMSAASATSRFDAVDAVDGPAPRTVAVATADDAVTAEQARLERERTARREARLAALAPVQEDDAIQAAPAPLPPQAPPKRVTDKFAGSLGLFLLRVATAAILFVHGLNGIINSKPVVDLWSNTVLPYPRYIALGVSIAEVAIAILLLFGVLTRVAGFVLLAIMAATLAFVMWGPWSVFEPGGMGFIGEHELLLGAVGATVLLLGAGGWSVDRMMRRSRDREGMEF